MVSAHFRVLRRTPEFVLAKSVIPYKSPSASLDSQLHPFSSPKPIQTERAELQSTDDCTPELAELAYAIRE